MQLWIGLSAAIKSCNYGLRFRPSTIAQLNVLSHNPSNRPYRSHASSCFFSCFLPGVSLIIITMDTTAVASASGQGSRNAGRKSGTPVWLQIEGVVAYHAMHHADEKVSESHELERHANAKTFFDAAIAGSCRSARSMRSVPSAFSQVDTSIMN